MKCFFPWQFACKQFITGGNFVFQNEYMYILYTRSYYCKKLLLERPSWKTCLQIAVSLSYFSSGFLCLTCEGHFWWWSGLLSDAYASLVYCCCYINISFKLVAFQYGNSSAHAALAPPPRSVPPSPADSKYVTVMYRNLLKFAY